MYVLHDTAVMLQSLFSPMSVVHKLEIDLGDRPILSAVSTPFVSSTPGIPIAFALTQAAAFAKLLCYFVECIPGIGTGARVFYNRFPRLVTP